jgi:hypothetical protein
MRNALFAGALGALLAATAAGQEAVEIKMQTPRVGDRIKVTIAEKGESKPVVSAGGNEMAKNETKAKNFVYVDEVLAVEKGASKPAKLTRTYEKAEEIIDGNSKTLSVEGKTVTIEMKVGKYSYTVDGKPVGADVAKMLDGEFNKKDKDEAHDLMFPKKAVKPGESWKVDAEKLAKGLGDGGLKLDATKIEAGGKLVRVYKDGDAQFGVIEIKVTAPITDLAGKAPIKVKSGSMAVTTSGDGCIDGTTAKGKTTTVMEFKIDGGGPEFTLSIVAKTTEVRTNVQLPKK